MKSKPKLLVLLPALFYAAKCFSQDTTDLISLTGKEAPAKEKVYGAFKSTRVIMAHSM